jgi:hypothetical protein
VSGVTQLANLDDQVAVLIVPLLDADFDSEPINDRQQAVKRKSTNLAVGQPGNIGLVDAGALRRSFLIETATFNDIVDHICDARLAKKIVRMWTTQLRKDVPNLASEVRIVPFCAAVAHNVPSPVLAGR